MSEQKSTGNKSQIKHDHRQALRFKQFGHERDMWKRTLGFIIDENVHLKNRISELLKDGIDGVLLEAVEKFHSRALQEDLLISLLRDDIAELYKLQPTDPLKDEEGNKEIEQQVRKLRNNINIADKQFSNLKLEFYTFFSENI